MAELVPAPFADLVARLHLEPQRQNALFELDRRRWWLPGPDAADLAVRFQGARAGNPLGPAAGPHTQMAQNLLLSYVAGGRILELKTVQDNDRLIISRPCIDVTNVGYNVEWSQELRVEQSIDEYVAGAMLIEMFRRSPIAAGRLDGPAGDCLLDLSVGYDLAGIRGDKVRRFLAAMRDAAPIIARLRGQIPPAFAAARDLDFARCLSTTLTLSTFHGCPADEIERIVEFLVADADLNVIVKMNPPTLGRERLEHLLFDLLGYTELTVNPSAYDAVVSFSDSIELCRRLTSFATARHRRVGFKFSNTLEVLNHRDFFKADQKVMYLSGQPLHVITLTLTDEVRRAVGPDVPVSFSAGIDQANFPLAVACGFVPITVSTDLLRPGGYGRMPAYLQRLDAELRKHHAATIDDYILARFGHASEAQRRAGPDAPRDCVVRHAAVLNTASAAELARYDPRYRAAANRKAPTRIDSTLETFDCITCDKCLPVCPNAANFTYPTPAAAFQFHDVVLSPAGGWSLGPPRDMQIEQAMQIACFADFCNECGNCDTFCPEYGGPYIRKPNFFGSRAAFDAAAPRDGFAIERDAAGDRIVGRVRAAPCELTLDRATGRFTYCIDSADVTLDSAGRPLDARAAAPLAAPRTVDLWPAQVMRYLLAGLLDTSRINQVNARFAVAP